MEAGVKGLLAIAVGAVVVTAAAAAAVDELRHSTKAGPLTNGAVYKASLFAPSALIETTAMGWEGSQYLRSRYHWLQLVYRGNDPARGGGMNIISAPGNKQSTAATIQLLHTVRVSSAQVGLKVGPVVDVTLHGYPAKQFDGDVTGPEGHTFVPFSGKSHGSSEAAGDHLKLLHEDLFRIIVTTIKGTPIVFFLDAGGAPRLNAEFLRQSTRIIDAMRFS
jgi:hypothetical protein